MKSNSFAIDRKTFLAMGATLIVGAGLSLVPGISFAADQPVYRVSVAKGYLALRTAKAYDDFNVIGQLHTGDLVTVQNSSDPTYWFVYSSKLGKSGYVNKNYLVGGEASYTVQVAKGFLALRNAKAYDDANIIGELYTGDTVQAVDTSDSKWWLVYSPKLGKQGYVNCNYLVGGGQVVTKTATVQVEKGYLALRTAKEYDDANVVGQLYTGDVVQIIREEGTYYYVYSTRLGISGYVNSKYLVGSDKPIDGSTYTVSVEKGYLALRTEKAYDDSNVIGQLDNGDVVQVQDKSDGRYWYVFAPKLNAYGYVDSRYLK